MSSYKYQLISQNCVLKEYNNNNNDNNNNNNNNNKIWINNFWINNFCSAALHF